MSLDSVKFPLKVCTYNDGSDYYDMTLDQLQALCCIYGCELYWKDSIPDEEEGAIDVYRPTLYDIWNYECVNWWDWPVELQKHVLDARERKAELRAKGLIR